MTRQEAYVVANMACYGIELGLDGLTHINHNQSTTYGNAGLLIELTCKMMRFKYRCYVLIQEYQRRYGDDVSCESFLNFFKNSKNIQDQVELMLAAIDVLKLDMNVEFATLNLD